MALEANLPPSDVNVPGDYFSLAGFEATSYGRFWATPEAIAYSTVFLSNIWGDPKRSQHMSMIIHPTQEVYATRPHSHSDRFQILVAKLLAQLKILALYLGRNT